MSTRADYTILGIGNPFIDHFSYVNGSFFASQNLKAGDANTTRDRSAVIASLTAAGKSEEDPDWTLGGSGCNVVRTLGHLGNRCALIGKIGPDRGDEIEERLKRIGVTPLLSRGTLPSAICNCFVNPGDKNSARTLHAYFGVTEEFTEMDVDPKAFQGIKHLDAEGWSVCFGKVLEMSIKYAKEQQASISLDLASEGLVRDLRTKFEECIQKVDYLFGNADEMLEMTHAESIEEAPLFFKKCQLIVMTDGKNGCWVKDKGSEDAVHYDAVKVPKEKIVDTTGAGDYFKGGFLDAALKGKSVARCVKEGSFAASLVIQHPGAELPEDRWNELIEFSRKV